MDFDLTSYEIIYSLLNFRLTPFDVFDVTRKVSDHIYMIFNPIVPELDNDIDVEKFLIFVDRKYDLRKQLFISFFKYSKDYYRIPGACLRKQDNIQYYSLGSGYILSVNYFTMLDELTINKLNIFIEKITDVAQFDLLTDIFDPIVDDLEEFENKLNMLLF
jgi:hypothetical protein